MLASAGCGQPESATCQAELVLVVPKICAGRYGAGRVGKGSTREAERVVARSAAGAAVGVAEEVRTDLRLSFFTF